MICTTCIYTLLLVISDWVPYSNCNKQLNICILLTNICVYDPFAQPQYTCLIPNSFYNYYFYLCFTFMCLFIYAMFYLNNLSLN